MPTPSRPPSPATPRSQSATSAAPRRVPPVSAPLPAKTSGVPTSNTATSASQRAAQALEAMRLKAHAVAAPPQARTPGSASKLESPRRRAIRKQKPQDENEGSLPLNTRRRLSSETRAQLIERLNNPLLTLQETSVVLRVCPATVRRYSNSGLLPHVRTEGNQRRFLWRDVQVLAREMEARRR